MRSTRFSSECSCAMRVTAVARQTALFDARSTRSTSTVPFSYIDTESSARDRWEWVKPTR